MDERILGGSGVAITRVILGCGNFGGIGSSPAFFGQGTSKEDAFHLMDTAWDAGITTFDTADAYGGGRSESFIGEWLATKGSVWCLSCLSPKLCTSGWLICSISTG